MGRILMKLVEVFLKLIPIEILVRLEDCIQFGFTEP